MPGAPVPVLFYYCFNRGMTGGPRTILNLISGIDRSRIRPVFATQVESALTEALRAEGVPVEIVPLPPVLDVYGGEGLRYSLLERARSFGALLRYTRSIRQVIRRHGAQVVWARGSKSVLFVGWASRREKRPLIWDIGLEEGNGRLVRMVRRYALAISSRVVTQAEAQREQIFGARLGARSAAKFRALSPGVADDEIARIERAAASGAPRDGRPRLLCVGTVSRRKNQRLVLDALPGIVAAHPDVLVSFAGPCGDEAYRRALDARIQELGVAENVEFLGWRENVPDLLAASDLLVLSSRGEGIPHVVREAMFAGVPVVGTRVGGVPEAIVHGTTGLLVHPEEPGELTDAVVSLLGDEAARARMAQAARARAGERFSMSAWIAAYESLLLTCAGRTSDADDPVGALASPMAPESER